MKKYDNNWYCHNICNYTKSDKINNTIFNRVFPLIKQEIILDIRPDIKVCNGDKYISADENSNTNINQSLHNNLYPKRNDKDCFFCNIVNNNKCNFSPNKPNLLHFLRSIDIDSYIRGLSYPLSNCNIFKKNPLICTENHVCMNCKNEIEWNPQLVNIINRWNIPEFKGLFNNIKNENVNLYCLNNKKNVPTEQLWNTQTKALYNVSKKI